MKKISTFISIILLFSLLLSALAGCKDSTKEQPDGQENEDSMSIAGYKIVRPDNATSRLSKTAALLKKSILSDTGADLTVITDYEAETEYEILIGETNRAESAAALSELKKSKDEQAFIISVSGKKISIVGHTVNDTVIGVKHFINEIVSNSKAENELPVTAGYKSTSDSGEIIYFSDDGQIIVLEQYSTIFNPPNQEAVHQATYGKIIRLEHNGKNNGILLATHETVGASDPRNPIYRSDDDGKTWKRISLVDDTYNTKAIVGYQPFLFELPEDVGEFKKGTILFSGCTRVGGDKTIMTLSYSTDIGETWTSYSNIDDGGGGYNDGDFSSEGLWEPCLIYDEETKRVYCFYSDELDPEHNQRLVYRYSTDLKNWSEKYECVACDDPNLRAGMVSLTKLGNGKYALAYEMCGMSGCPIYIKIADALDDWGDISDPGHKVVTEDGEGFGSAPAITWTPAGGEKGTLFVIAAHTLNGESSTKCDLMISFDYGETFIDIDNPIPVAKNDNVRNGYSPGLFTSEDGTVYYVNNVEKKKGGLNEQLIFTRLRVY